MKSGRGLDCTSLLRSESRSLILAPDSGRSEALRDEYQGKTQALRFGRCVRSLTVLFIQKSVEFEEDGGDTHRQMFHKERGNVVTRI